jgi:hypothetical protein
MKIRAEYRIAARLYRFVLLSMIPTMQNPEIPNNNAPSVIAPQVRFRNPKMIRAAAPMMSV